MFRRYSAAAAVVWVAVAACSRGGGAKADARGGAKADARADALVRADADAGTDADADAAARGDAAAAVRTETDAGVDTRARKEDASFAGTPRSVKSIGHTSLVFKVELDGGRKAAFKPASKRGPVRYKGEIAARRFGFALGIEANVPVAFFRTYPSSAFARAAGQGDMLVTAGVVKGALLPWIDGLKFLPLEQAPLSGQ